MAIRILMSALHMLKIRNLGDDVRCNDEGAVAPHVSHMYVCTHSANELQ